VTDGSIPDDFGWTVRTAVYRHFVDHVEAPTLPALANRVGASSGEVRAALDVLEAAHQIALLPDGSGIWMANPFSAVPTDFPVRTARGNWWANCAWDALGIPAVLGTDTWTDARCAHSGEPIGFGVEGGRRIGDDGIVHLVVPPRDAWEDIGFT